MKGSVMDLMYLVVFAVVLPLVIIIADYIGSSLTGTPVNSRGYLDTVLAIIRNYDYIFFIAFILLGVVITSLASRNSAHPIFLFMAILMWAVVLLIGTTVSNMYLDIISVEPFASVSVNYPLSTFVNQHMPLILIIFSALISILIYRRGGQRVSE